MKCREKYGVNRPATRKSRRVWSSGAAAAFRGFASGPIVLCALTSRKERQKQRRHTERLLEEAQEALDAGELAQAEKLAGPLLPPGYATFRIARSFAKLGDADHAIEAIGRAIDAGFAPVAALETGPEFESLRADARFSSLVARARKIAFPCEGVAGYRQFDCYTPFPIEELAEAMGQHHSRLPLLVLIGGILGAVGGFALCYWTSVIEYPLIVGGRPFNSVGRVSEKRPSNVKRRTGRGCLGQRSSTAAASAT